MRPENPFATPLIAGAAFTSVYTGKNAKYVFGCSLLYPRKKNREVTFWCTTRY